MTQHTTPEQARRAALARILRKCPALAPAIDKTIRAALPQTVGDAEKTETGS